MRNGALLYFLVARHCESHREGLLGWLGKTVTVVCKKFVVDFMAKALRRYRL